MEVFVSSSARAKRARSKANRELGSDWKAPLSPTPLCFGSFISQYFVCDLDEQRNDCEVISGLQASPRNGTKVRCLQDNKRMSEKSVFPETLSPEMTSQSFPVSSFWSRGFLHHQKWNFPFMVHQNTGKKNRSQIYFFCYIYQNIAEILSSE